MRWVWILGILALVGGGGFAVYYALSDRVVAFGESQGFKWKVVRVGDLFCPEIRDTRTHSGFAPADFQKLDCHPTIGLAKGEALLAIANSVGLGDEGVAGGIPFPLIQASPGPGPVDLQETISGLAALP